MKVLQGDSRDVIRTFPANTIDSCVCDPPYALVSIQKRFSADNAAPAQHGKDGLYARASAGFMGKKWDTGEVAFDPAFWVEVLRVLKPGAHVLAFGGTRSYHRLACAIEDAGFEIRDQIGWLYGSGLPKSHDVSKGIDAKFGAKREVIGERRGSSNAGMNGIGQGGFRQNGEAFPVYGDPATAAAAAWEGWGTALKPAWEPIVLARKPLIGTVAENVLAHGTGAINIDACRVGEGVRVTTGNGKRKRADGWGMNGGIIGGSDLGRWPANVIHDGSDEVIAAFPVSKSGVDKGERGTGGIWQPSSGVPCGPQYGDSGSAARFFYCAKASKADRNEGCDDLPDREGGMRSETSGQRITRRDGGDPKLTKNHHPTVKPTVLMQYLCRLVTPPGGVVLDPFMGSGSTGKAALRENFDFIGIEREKEYFEIALRRIGAEVLA